VKGLIGGMIGAAIVNSGNSTEANSNNQKKYKKPSISSAERADNKRVQENLNYFGFNTGIPDGIFGRKTKEAVYKFQGCLNRPMTGVLDNFEKQFLEQSTFKAQANGTQTLQFIAQSPNGYCGLLQKYFLDLTAPQPAIQPATSVVATTTSKNTSLQVASSTTNVISVDNSVNVNVIATDVQAKYDRLSDELALLQQIEAHIKEKSNQPGGTKKLKAIIERLAVLRSLIVEIEVKVNQEYGTPVRPTNGNLGITAVKASEVFPRVPYYIPGTSEEGELWIKPYVSDGGMLNYDFNFTTKQSEFEKIQDKIVFVTENLTSLEQGMVKINGWSDTAQEKGVRKRYEKVAACFPFAQCQDKIEGNTSTEIVFLIYEDGSTAASIRRNKGRFSKGYNLSVESGLLLAAYASYMNELGSKEFFAATATDADLDDMFK
jgi:peptidoglycan hydrolase-like protein with peptidoglycan-binding domain